MDALCTQGRGTGACNSIGMNVTSRRSPATALAIGVVALALFLGAAQPAQAFLDKTASSHTSAWRFSASTTG